MILQIALCILLICIVILAIHATILWCAEMRYSMALEKRYHKERLARWKKEDSQ